MQDGPTTVFEKQPRVILTTPRLILRTATEPDIKVMWERVLGDGDVMRYVFQGVPMTFERAGEVMRKFFTFGDTLTGIAILTEKSTAEIIGCAGRRRLRDRLCTCASGLGQGHCHRDRQGPTCVRVRTAQLQSIARPGRSAKRAVYSCSQKARNEIFERHNGTRTPKPQRLLPGSRRVAPACP